MERMISARASPVFTKTLRFDRTQIAPVGPGPQGQMNPALQQPSRNCRLLIKPRPQHNRGPQLERPPLFSMTRSLLTADLAAQMKQQPRYVDLHRANFETGAAETRRVRQLRCLLNSDQLRCDHRTDWPRINRTVSMPTDLLVHRTNIQT